jgi:hypothetical protein
VRLEKSETVDDIFDLVMSAVEWKEIHALAKFAQAGIAYDCKTHYVAQVFVYTVTEPEGFRDDENLKAAFTALDDLMAHTTPDGKNNIEVVLELPKEKMRQFLVIVRKAAESERQANLLHSAIPKEFPYAFPDLQVASGYYADAFADILMALGKNQAMNIGRPAV